MMDLWVSIFAGFIIGVSACGLLCSMRLNDEAEQRTKVENKIKELQHAIKAAHLAQTNLNIGKLTRDRLMDRVWALTDLDEIGAGR